jgi:thiamine-monophosphate kinase
MSLGLPDDWQESWLAAFSRGIAAECRDYRVKLARFSAFRAPGGPVVSIAAWGETDPSHYRSRFGASPGDRLYVTGTLGDAALGERVRMSDRDFYPLRGAATLLTHYLKPRPPVSFAPLIARFASASLNLTGGLLNDLQDLARASRVSFEVDGRRLPFSAAVREAFSIGDVMQLALTGRGDYQFLFTVPEELVSPLRAAAGTQRVEISEIGKAADGAGEVILRHLAKITLPARA